ncbi:hypothetical protein MU582_11560 [Nocardioidaceae bacterium SCSIO 66511]|nr:hypothetical protein MU582_11560 [Nocardioidaceae bacterium SCSIO 66511]
MTLRAEADELYGLPLEEFVASRNARTKEVRASGDRATAAQIAKLRKPRRVAWVLNMFVRRQPEDVDRLVDLGSQIRTAQGDADRDELRSLDRARRDLTAELTRRARSIAGELGHDIDDLLAAEVENTLRTAMADAAGGAALRTGLLLDGFGTTGFEPVDIEKVVAVPDAASIPAESRAAPAPPQGRHLRAVRTSEPAREKKPANRPDPRAAARARAQQDLDQARRTLDQARRTLAEADAVREQATSGHTEATNRRESLESERLTLQERLRALDRELAQAHRAEDKAERERDRAERAQAAAQRAVDTAERRSKQTR